MGFFDFANIMLNPSKCELFRINGKGTDKNIVIDGVEKNSVTKNFVKYLGIPLGLRKICKTKFIEAKIQKVLEELDKAEFSGLAINQIVRVIRCHILNKLYFIFANMNLPKRALRVVDKKVRSVINNFSKGQPLQKSFIYTSVKNGGLGIPCMEDEYAAYKIHHVANLMATSDVREILNGYLNLNKKVAKHPDLLGSLDKALEHLNITWLDWDEFKNKRRKFEWTQNQKNDKLPFRIKDNTTKEVYTGNLKNIHRSLLSHARIIYD
jgi:hypothetical protein